MLPQDYVNVIPSYAEGIDFAESMDYVVQQLQTADKTVAEHNLKNFH
jgi:soluble cytochrome b562